MMLTKHIFAKFPKSGDGVILKIQQKCDFLYLSVDNMFKCLILPICNYFDTLTNIINKQVIIIKYFGI